jgi:hypothetical protein
MARPWRLLTFTDPSLVPCKCHPYFARKRKEYMHTKFNASPNQELPCKSARIDFGGMVRTTDPQITIPLGPGREFRCYEHHAEGVVFKLEKKLQEGPRPHDCGFYKVGTFPGMLLFLSKRDIRKILRALKNGTCPAKIADYSRLPGC